MAPTESTFEKLEQLVFSNKVPSQAALQDEDYDDLLDERDEDGFAQPWTKSYNTINKAYIDSGLTDAYKARIDKIREYTFKRVYKETESSDLSSYLSDDFDLILKAMLTNSQDSWVNALWQVYTEGQIPKGVLENAPGDLKDLI